MGPRRSNDIVRNVGSAEVPEWPAAWPGELYGAARCDAGRELLRLAGARGAPDRRQV